MSLSVNSTSERKDEKSINILDIVKYLLFHWKWYVLTILLFGGYAYYQYSKTPFLYKQSMSIIIKTPNNSQTTMRMNRFNSFSTPVNIASEILQFRSKDLMRHVIERSQANISYIEHIGLRDNELYNQSPIQVSFIEDKPNNYTTFDVKLINNRQVEIIFDSKNKVITFGDIVNTPNGKIIISPSDAYSKSWFGRSIKVTKCPSESLVGHFLGGLTITQTDDAAAVIQLQLEDNSPARAANVLNTLLELYNYKSKEDKNSIADTTEQFIKRRLSIIESGLDSVETTIEDMQREYGGMDVESAAGLYINDSRSYQNKGKELSTQLKLLNYMKQYLLDTSRKNELLPSNTGLIDASIDNQIAEYNNILAKRNHLISDGENNPIIENYNKTLAALKQTIIESMNNVIMGISIRRNDINNEANNAIGEATQVPAKKRQILSIERQQKVKQDLYVFLLNKKEENALNKAMTEDNARVIDPASGSYAPIYPNKYKKVLMGVGVGIALPTIIFLLILMLDTTVHTRKEIEEAIDVPFLAEIPYSKDSQTERAGILVRAKGHDSLSESFRILRTNLGFMAAGNVQKVITFTSFNVGAGKTFTSLNMAASLIQIDKKVILVDLDLRKGTLSNQLKAKKDIGVTHYLSDSSVELDDVIMKNILEDGIDLIPIGVIAPNPVELLLSKRLDQLIEELKSKYDYIVIDNVPLGVVADSSIINRITDVTIFVVRSGKLDKRQLPELQRIYTEHKLNNMAVLLNGVQKSAFSYGYGYGGYGYGYGYGYGNKKKYSWKFWKK